jgi:plastocyanin
VTLQSGPKKVDKKDFKSATGSIGIKFNPVFKKAGTYKFICTIHPDVMKQTVKVKK